MPYTMEDFRRDYVKEHLKDLTVEEILEGMSTEDILKCYLDPKFQERLTTG